MTSIQFNAKAEELFPKVIEEGRKAIEALRKQDEAEGGLRSAEQAEKDAGHELEACEPDEYREYAREHSHAIQQLTHASREYDRVRDETAYQVDDFNMLVGELEGALKGVEEVHRDLVSARFACYQPDPEGPHGWKSLQERVEIFVKFISDLADSPSREYRQQLVVSARNLGVNPDGRNNEELSRIIDQYMWADMAAMEEAHGS